MTYQDEAVEVRRTSVGTKVLIFACAILAVLGSFWSIVWFIRAYVEAPRVGIPQAIALAARDTTPVVPPAATAAPAPIMNSNSPANGAAAPAQTTPQQAAETATAPKADQSSTSISDRWLPAAPAPAQPVEQPAQTQTAPTETAAAPEAEPPADEVAESSVPAIAGPAPLPRRKPTQTALAKRADPPLPRPRPDGPAPQSVWTAAPTSDDRFPTQ